MEPYGSTHVGEVKERGKVEHEEIIMEDASNEQQELVLSGSMPSLDWGLVCAPLEEMEEVNQTDWNDMS